MLLFYYIYLFQREHEKTKGKKWYGLPATELTAEVKHDLEVLQMRSVLDPKHFYKKNDLKVLPKYFQVSYKHYLLTILNPCIDYKIKYFSYRSVKLWILHWTITTIV